MGWSSPRPRTLTLTLAEPAPALCVQVGGDGLFQEVLNGALAVRAAGGAAGAAAERLRLGHIPAGSTDAVACSLHGTRCGTTAALHIALGDRRAYLPCVPPPLTGQQAHPNLYDLMSGRPFCRGLGLHAGSRCCSACVRAHTKQR